MEDTYKFEMKYVRSGLHGAAAADHLDDIINIIASLNIRSDQIVSITKDGKDIRI